MRNPWTEPGWGWGWKVLWVLWWLVLLAWRCLPAPLFQVAAWGFRRVRKYRADVRADKAAARAVMSGGERRPADTEEAD